MARKINKKQKRDKKKKIAQKASATREYDKNKQLKSSVNFDESLSFTEPRTYYLGYPNETLGAEDYGLMMDGCISSDIEVAIYPATESFCRFLNHLSKNKVNNLDTFEGVGWIVVNPHQMLPIKKFSSDELEVAKQFVLSNYPSVKTIRTNDLGLIEGKPDFLDLLSFRDSTTEQWIEYALNVENNYGFSFVPDDCIHKMISVLINDYNASEQLLSFYDREGNLTPSVTFARENNLEGFLSGLRVMERYDTDYSRCN